MLPGPDYQTQTRIEGFSGARLDFLTFPTPNEYGIRITGTVPQAYYAIQACNAVVSCLMYMKLRYLYLL